MPPLTTSPFNLPVAFRPITVDEYHAMGRASIFGPEERVELLSGHLLAMFPVCGSHFRITNRLTSHFARHVYRDEGDLAHVSVQGPIRLDDLSEPEPNLTLLRPESDDELEVALAPEALLVIEVSDTTLAYDRGVKRDRYAQAGIPEVWIVALDDCYVETAHTPSAWRLYRDKPSRAGRRTAAGTADALRPTTAGSDRAVSGIRPNDGVET